MTALSCGPLTPKQAEAVAGWVTSRAEVILFAGPNLGFPLAGGALLATNTPSSQVFGLCDENGTLMATGSLGPRGRPPPQWCGCWWTLLCAGATWDAQ